MGLDWCVEAKVPTKNVTLHEAASKLLEAGKREHDRQVSAWTEKNPNSEHADFAATSAGKAIARTVREYEVSLRSLEVAAAVTLGAPVVGRDESADTWVRENWKRLRRFDTEAAALTELLGDPMVVPELLTEESRKGLGSITGIAAGAESFRGKALGFIGWLPEHLLDEAYTDHTPDQLADYGARLMEIVKRAPEIIRGAGLDPHEEQQNHEVFTLRSAARWCLFWGVRGHGMHAWY